MENKEKEVCKSCEKQMKQNEIQWIFLCIRERAPTSLLYRLGRDLRPSSLEKGANSASIEVFITGIEGVRAVDHRSRFFVTKKAKLFDMVRDCSPGCEAEEVLKLFTGNRPELLSVKDIDGYTPFVRSCSYCCCVAACVALLKIPEVSSQSLLAQERRTRK